MMELRDRWGCLAAAEEREHMSLGVRQPEAAELRFQVAADQMDATLEPGNFSHIVLSYFV
jgi:hypothetical protein